MTLEMGFNLLQNILKINIISAINRIVDTDVVNDVTSTCENVNTCVVIRFLCTALSTESQRRHMINLK